MIRDLLAKHHFRVDQSGELFVFSRGRFAPAPQSWTHDRLTEMISWELRGMLTKSMLDTVHANLKPKQPRMEMEPPRGKVNFVNGLWDSNVGFMGPPTCDQWPSVVQIPTPFEPGAQCPAWDRFLAEILPPDALAYAWEIIGSCLVSDLYSQKVVWLSGLGGNGKSTFLKALIALIGAENTAAISFKTLAQDRFAAAHLYGKLLVVDGDSSLDQIKSSELLKQITAHDPIYVQHKGKPGFNFTPFCKAIVASNGQPNASDISKGFLDRPEIVPFDSRLRGSPGERHQQDLLEELASEGSGAINRALEGLLRVITRRRLQPPLSVIDATRDYQRDVHPMVSFAEDHLLASSKTDWVPEPQMRRAYLDWAAENRIRRLTNVEIRDWIKANMPEVFIGREDRIKGTGSHGYWGLRLTEPSIF